MRILFAFLLMVISFGVSAQSYKLSEQNDRWFIQPDGSIQRTINGRIPHSDDVEMAGERVAMWMQYGVDSSAKPKLSRTLVFPSFLQIITPADSRIEHQVSPIGQINWL